jgi:thiol-disulfide isomerase/thioredoxin
LNKNHKEQVKKIIVFLIFAFCVCSAQKKITIKGNFDEPFNGGILLYRAYDGKYQDSQLKDSAEIKNGVYEINNFKINHPGLYSVFITFGVNHREKIENIYLDTLNKTYYYDKEKNIKKVTKLSKDQKDYNDFFAEVFADQKTLSKSKIKTVDDFEKGNLPILQKEDKLLIKFTKIHPNSYFALWQLVRKQKNNGYKIINEKAFNNLSSKIRKSKLGLQFSKDIIAARQLLVGNLFPVAAFDNPAKITLGEKYTLIDFWFSYCSPCIMQMPKYLEINKKYSGKDFQIVQISTDVTKNVENWKRIIKKYDLPWQNLLDENALVSETYYINVFPTNFLLDSDGKILKRDISQVDLEKFLEENLNN